MAYVPDPQNVAPYMGAGAKLRFAISNPTIGVNYSVSVLTQPLSLIIPAGPTYDWAYDPTIPTQYTNDGGVWTGSETGVVETCGTLLPLLAAFYGSNWTLSLLGVQRRDFTNNVWRRVSPFPTAASHAGTFGTNPSGTTDPALGHVLRLRAPTRLAPADAHTKVGRLNVNLPAADLLLITKRVFGITGSTTPSGIVTAHMTALIAYLSGSATRIVGHNGGLADNRFAAGVGCSDRIARAAHLIL